LPQKKERKKETNIYCKDNICSTLSKVMANFSNDTINSSSQLIFCPEKLDSNLCMFYAIYNALPTIELKLAFSCGNSEHPSNKFVEVNRQWKTEETVAKDGYNQIDMQKYLRYLCTNSYIQSFTWKRIKSRTATFHTVWNNRPKGNSQYVLFGLCTTGPSRDLLIKRLKGVHGGRSGKAKMQEQIRVYHHFNSYSIRDCTDHAISITNSREGLLVSDNARKRKYVVNDMTDIAKSLISFQCLHVLDIELNNFDNSE